MLFGGSPRGLFLPFFFFFLKIPPLPLSYPRADGDRFPQKIYIPRGANSRGHYGRYIQRAQFIPILVVGVREEKRTLIGPR